MPKILTVITPTLNVADTIGKTLQSIREVAQIHPDTIEHIVVDGGSTDATLQLLEKQSDSSLNVPPYKSLLLHDQGQGISEALNLALEAASGKFIAVLNADDFWIPEAMSEVVWKLQRSSEPQTIYYADVIQYDPLTDRSFKRHASIQPISKYMSLYHCALFIPAVIHAEVGNYDTSYRLAMDCEITHRCLSYKLEFEALPNIVATMRLRGRSHENTLAAMKEFERSVLHHGLLSRPKARLYRIRQTIFHSLHRSAWFQSVWDRQRTRARILTRGK